MKKHYFFLLAITFCTSLGAQEIWLETALKGGGGMSFLYNKNIADDGSYKYKITPMYGVGGKFSVNFGPYNGITLEALYNFSGQDFDYRLTGSTSDLQNNISWKSIDAYLLYRHIRSRVYVELGPMYGLIKSVEQMDNGVELTEPDMFYEKNYLGGAFGFGGYIAGSSTFSVGLGMRVTYGFTDFVNEEGQAAGFPNPVKKAPYNTVATTHPAFAQILLEFNFGIGHFAKTSCSKRMQFFGPGNR